MNWTDEQLRVIEHCGSHAIVTAVAGSGKTSTLVAHILRQLERGQDPNRILVLMFNRSAREDFQRKLAGEASRVVASLSLPDIRTYHSMGLRLYRHFVKSGWLQSWQGDPLSGARMDLECWRILQRIAPASMQDALKNDKSTWVSELTGFIDLVKSTIRTPETVFDEYEYNSRKKILLQGYHAFEEWRKEHKLITYADMLYEPVMLMLREPELVAQVTNRMDLMLVDEYQDTNEVQHTLLKIIAGRRAQVMVVGDPDQTIYEFRGARPEYILKTFAEDFLEPVQYTLSYTFRYGHRLSLVADHLITHNQGRGDTLCLSHYTTPDTQIEKVESSDPARWLVAAVADLTRAGRRLCDVTVLVRLWSQTVTLEMALLEAGIPFVSEAEKGPFDRQEIQLLAALLELAAGKFEAMPADTRFQKLWQILRFPHVGIKDEWLKSFCRDLAGLERGYGKWLIDQSQKPLQGLSDYQKYKIQDRGRLLSHIERGGQSAARTLDRYIQLVELGNWLVETALDRDRAEEQVMAVKSFIRYLGKTSQTPGEACDFIADLRARRKAEANRTRQDSLLLTSMHKAKGLEWPVVILPGLTDRHLPCNNGDEVLSETRIESERRLFYVAMTRARNQLFLVTAPADCAHRRGTSADRQPSRFIVELRLALSCQAGEALGRTSEETGELALDFPESGILTRYLETVRPGLKLVWNQPPETREKPFMPPWRQRHVSHSIFGDGVVLSETGTDFKVRFEEDGGIYHFSKKSAHLYFL